jgi:hypothetical protein
VTRKAAQIAFRREQPVETAQLADANGLSPDARLAGEIIRDLLFTFIVFERTGAVDNRAARDNEVGCAVEQAALQIGERGDVGFVLQPGDVGMTANRARGGSWCIDQHAVERGALPFGGIGGDAFGFKMQAREVFAHARKSALRAVDRRNFRARCCELRGFSAGRRADVGNALAVDVAEQSRRQGGSGILNPPGAFGEAGQ